VTYDIKANASIRNKLRSQPVRANALGRVRAPVPTIRLKTKTKPT
jgi:hypothetical protein